MFNSDVYISALLDITETLRLLYWNMAEKHIHGEFKTVDTFEIENAINSITKLINQLNDSKQLKKDNI